MISCLQSFVLLTIDIIIIQCESWHLWESRFAHVFSFLFVYSLTTFSTRAGLNNVRKSISPFISPIIPSCCPVFWNSFLYTHMAHENALFTFFFSANASLKSTKKLWFCRFDSLHFTKIWLIAII